MKLAISVLSFLFIFGEFKIIRFFCIVIIDLNLIRFIGINASPFSSEENINFDLSSELSPETYSIIGKIKCKLCKEAMKFVENEINNESAKVYEIDRFVGRLNRS